MFLFIDTETTGKADFRAPASADHQPHLVQIGAILADHAGREVGALDVIIRPDGYVVPTEAAAIHGITDAMATAYGVPLLSALILVSNFMHAAETLVAHNLDFDSLVLESALIRAQERAAGAKKCADRLAAIQRFCTMKATTPICQLPGQYKDFKWPKLGEAYKHLFNEELSDAHSAIADCRACKRIYFAIQKPTPQTSENV